MEALLNKPIQSVYPEINTDGSNDPEPPFLLTIQHINHNLTVGTKIKIVGAISTFGIPDTVINGDHIITSVPTINSYTIIINNINLNATRTNTGGGNGVYVYVPTLFKLYFNYPDTMGKQLGFRNVGDENSIFAFNTVITNTDAYATETITVDDSGLRYIYDRSGNLMLLKNNAIKLNGYDYILLAIREFANIKTISDIKTLSNYFAKINLKHNTKDYMIYDTFVSTTSLLYDPIDLSQLTISFYAPDGSLYDFCGINHSFVLEITSINYIPDETEIDTSNSPF